MGAGHKILRKVKSIRKSGSKESVSSQSSTADSALPSLHKPSPASSTPETPAVTPAVPVAQAVEEAASAPSASFAPPPTVANEPTMPLTTSAVSAELDKASWSPLQSPTVQSRRSSAYKKSASVTNMTVQAHSYERHFASSPSATPHRRPSISSFSTVALNKITVEDFVLEKSGTAVKADEAKTPKQSLSRISTQLAISDNKELLMRTTSRIFDDMRESRGGTWKSSTVLVDDDDDDDDALVIKVSKDRVNIPDTELWVKEQDHTLDDVENTIQQNHGLYLLKWMDWILGLDSSPASKVLVAQQTPVANEERLKKREQAQSMMDVSLILSIACAALGR